MFPTFLAECHSKRGGKSLACFLVSNIIVSVVLDGTRYIQRRVRDSSRVGEIQRKVETSYRITSQRSTAAVRGLSMQAIADADLSHGVAAGRRSVRRRCFHSSVLGIPL